MKDFEKRGSCIGVRRARRQATSQGEGEGRPRRADPDGQSLRARGPSRGTPGGLAGDKRPQYHHTGCPRGPWAGTDGRAPCVGTEPSAWGQGPSLPSRGCPLPPGVRVCGASQLRGTVPGGRARPPGSTGTELRARAEGQS